MRRLHAIARSTVRWVFVGFMGVAPAGSAFSEPVEFFRTTSGTSRLHAVALSDVELEGLRGRQLPNNEEVVQNLRRRVVLWDEARTASQLDPLAPQGVVVIRGASGASKLRPAIR